ncbi:LON peptidase N-terminal domain and RING finger protein 1 isoform X1 [Notothenia coriiceps]|uniref:LON peptidase N-terminal domain and RING finger protein 1 isoform X1 n=1 Tax=Notothenia coriiceps TaxID=8208 RepID=A0A6I9MYJ2_9TELE|nr:PREDICTED: LON peptidase N-terminal domain and RING finger protein 1 isoform X1 [Notothenia coriiceps]XP_010766690.1 PREDICTED: LON peptidase N-terminal domain and RING finger protein 1 isoform X1 [Notothenia coriiceps]
MDILECPLCLFLMCEPVTMACGHTFCRRCVGGYLPSKCPVCKERLKQRDVKSMKNNIMLISVIEKCCPDETKTKYQVQEKLKSNDFTEALRIANEGLHLVPHDQSLKVYRAEANWGLMHFSDALTDLDYLCCLRPNWTEGFLRKGNVLLEMGQQTDALIQFHRCLKLQADFAPAKSQIKKILEAEGRTVPEEGSCILQVVSEYLKGTCPITSLSGSQGPTHPDKQACGDDREGKGRREAHEGSKAKYDTGTECCLSLCQAVSFLPAAEEDEEMMMRKEDGHGRGESGHSREKTLSVLTVSDFECPLCIRLFYEPASTPCGHTFCKNCIERSLDHNLRCPLCKQPLQEYFKNRKYNPTILLQDIMTSLFPSQLAERKQVHETEMAELSNLTKDIPIFVCTVAYPGVPCPLHIFEPRYRLMMRRCMDTGTKKFGMCSYEHGKGFSDFGCMLEILSLEVLPDGRSFVDAVGVSRFKVLRRGQRDGYSTADIEYLEDLKVEGSELEVLEGLHDSVYQQAQDWYQRLAVRIRDQISRQYGTMPEKDENIQASSNGPAWCWWLLSVLQLDPAYQTTVLSLASLKDRLGHLRLVLEYFSQS